MKDTPKKIGHMWLIKQQPSFQEVHWAPPGRMVIDLLIITNQIISESRERDSEITLHIKPKSTSILPGGALSTTWKNGCRFMPILQPNYFGISWKRFRNNLVNQMKIDNHPSRMCFEHHLEEWLSIYAHFATKLFRNLMKEIPK